MPQCRICVIRLSDDLPPRFRANPRGLRPVPRGSGELPPKLFSGGLRRTSGERSADTGRLRADTGGSARSPPRTGGRVHSKNVRRQKLILHLCSSRKNVRGGRPSAAEILVGSGLGLGLGLGFRLGLWLRLGLRLGLGLEYHNPNPNPDPTIKKNISAAEGRPRRKFSAGNRGLLARRKFFRRASSRF